MTGSSVRFGGEAARMSRRMLCLVCMVGGAVTVLTGCSTTPKPVVSNRLVRYDLGPSAALPPSTLQGDDATASQAVRPQVLATNPPALKLMPVSASASLDDDRIRYRLDYADIREARTYANSRWSGTPSQLLTDRLRARLASRVEVLQGGDPERAPLLRIELIDFSQRFTSARQGVGVVSVRASLRAPWPSAAALQGAKTGASPRSTGANRWVAQREFTVSVPCPSPNAAGAAAAIADASDKVAAAVGDWVIVALQTHLAERGAVE
ncbi:ABC-type transport auxiliary lipoprotein family protein [Robbsia andropogonis]|uniref:ABC-type transport auxiliary lipoprotein family protein n=1 Tax=Robbsia andropogonis TaxID=28092 RepID=UPI00046460D8|nr:ABC-type transport auxiliary lipoprotein family protein [Robbsia andropogonis]MCP1120643.1 PqiC family protein [Robbsia andropogonis]MCP1130378.1 PqiC family protein [Robbsia andropogonis]